MSWLTQNGKLGDTHPIRKLYDTVPQSIQSFIHGVIESLGVTAHVALLDESPLRRRGWFQSYGNKPIDRRGDSLPWMPYAFIDFAEPRFDSSMNVFEYGCGHSTRWLADRVNKVISVEHDGEWCKYINSRTPENATVIHRSHSQYAEAITSFKESDVVIVDGIRRIASVREAIRGHTGEGIIILDDAKRDEYSEADHLLKENGFRRIIFQGMGPYSSNLQATAVYYRDKNCFGI